MLLLLGLELLDFLLEVSLSVLGLQLLAHGKGHRTILKTLRLDEEGMICLLLITFGKGFDRQRWSS